MLDNIKTLLGLNDSSKDELLTILLEQAIEEAISYTHNNCLAGLESTICRMVVSFIACAFVCVAMYYGGIIAKVAFMVAVIITLIRSNRNFSRKSKETEDEDNAFRLMMRSNDPEIVWDLLRNHVSRTQSYVNRFALSQYNKIVEGLAEENVRELGKCTKQLKTEQQTLKKYRRQEMLALKKLPFDIAIERNTWFHLGANSDQQFI